MWQPIETAPKDGTEILAYYGQEGRGQILILAWDENWWGPGNGDWVLNGEKDYATPTHWMPLPAPPIED